MGWWKEVGTSASARVSSLFEGLGLEGHLWCVCDNTLKWLMNCYDVS